MFAALCNDLAFFKDKINLAIMLAPVARLDRLTSTTLQNMKENENVSAFAERIGPELLPNPQVDGKISSGFMKATGALKFGVGLISDEDSNAISQQGLETYVGHFPAGTSFRCLNHFRQLMVSGKF
jgi:hypothetical protein